MILDVTAPLEADIADVKAYAGHVKDCATCKRANVDPELCELGGALWDAVCGDLSDCRVTAAIEMHELVGGALIPIGIFCREHWASERTRYNAAGGRTSMRVIRPEDGPALPCMWIRTKEET